MDKIIDGATQILGIVGDPIVTRYATRPASKANSH